MKYAFPLLVIVLALVFSFSCKDSSTNVPQIESPKTIATIINVPWWLKNLTLGDSVVNLQSYLRFQFSIGDTTVFGNDGCNYYNGRCSTGSDSIFVQSLGSTLMACVPVEQLDSYLLHGRWAVVISDTVLVLKRNDSVFTFSSAYTKSTEGQSFISKRWNFINSNDTTYASLLTPNLIPALKMTANREFGVRWYYNRQYTGKYENDEGGIFGICEGGLIRYYLMYHTYSHAANEPNSWYDGLYIRRILRSDHYSYTDSTLRLENQSAGYYYNFTLLVE